MLSVSLIFFFVIICLIIGSIRWYLTIPANLPPGPIGLPFVGSSFHTWRSSNLHTTLHRWTQVYGPLYKFYVAEKLVLVLGDWSTVREALVTNGDAFAGRPHLNLGGGDISGSGLVHSEGEHHKIQRRFALSTLRDFGFGRSILEPSIQHTCTGLIEQIDKLNGQAFEPKFVLARSVNKVIYSLVFGSQTAMDEDHIEGAMQFLSATTESPISILTPFAISEYTGAVMTKLPNFLSAFNPKSASGRQAFFMLMQNGIDGAMKNFDADIDQPTNYVQAFRKAQKEREDNWSFTEAQLGRSAVDLFAAGTDTTSITLTWALFYLAQYPDVQEEVYNEIRRETGGQAIINFADRKNMPFTEATIMETQRLANLLPLGPLRRTMNDCELCGYRIPAGTVVVPLLTAVLQDPIVFPNPETFDPRRFLKGEHGAEDAVQHLIPFSVGKRSCLGESLAKMELFLFFTSLVSQFRFHFPTNEPIPGLKEERVSIVRAPPPFKICAHRREQ